MKKYCAIFKDVLVKIEERRDNKVRHNIFDSIPSNIVSGKDNVFANFLQSAGLYDFMQIGEGSNRYFDQALCSGLTITDEEIDALCNVAVVLCRR